MRSRDGGNSDEFIREVDEAVRQDRWTEIWKQYNAYIVGAALAVVVGTAAGIGWQTYQKNTSDANARRLAAATSLLADDKPAEAASAFRALANETGSGVGIVARLRAAEAAKEAGNANVKVDDLNALADDGDVPPLYARLARLLALQETFDDTDADGLIKELDQAATPDNPWRASLLELKAMAEMKAGRTDEARATLQALLDAPATPGNLARRASELLQALGGPLEADNQTVSQNSNDEVSQ
jgi:hypothetical protein